MTPTQMEGSASQKVREAGVDKWRQSFPKGSAEIYRKAPVFSRAHGDCRAQPSPCLKLISTPGASPIHQRARQILNEIDSDDRCCSASSPWRMTYRLDNLAPGKIGEGVCPRKHVDTSKASGLPSTILGILAEGRMESRTRIQNCPGAFAWLSHSITRKPDDHRNSHDPF